MLSIPQGDRAQDHDGAPYVEFPDSPEDVATFLSFMYQPFTNPLKDTDPDLAFKMFGVMKLADKFMVDALKQMIVDRLRRDWPRSLKEWDEKQDVWEQNKSSVGAFAYPEPASAIRLARAFDSDPPLLNPVMFYALSCRDPIVDYGEPQAQGNVEMGARWVLVSHQDRNKIERGRRAILRFIFVGLSQYKLQCGQKDQSAECSEFFAESMDDIHQEFALKFDPLMLLRNYIGRTEVLNIEGGPVRACGRECIKGRDYVFRELRTAIFSRLSQFFADMQ
ncbi:unnamed protein product [Cyclocybe aegerita]|uniref:Uncharacterized protein n=1 Tax=Cyclocybe aegerita TaxID=1973307 RepID=A0A8S0W3J1_CYCAE|nr:unnamed protein product [Cyclocybe aegerita]